MERDLELFFRVPHWHEQRHVLMSILEQYQYLSATGFRHGLLWVTRNGPLEQTLMVLDCYAEILTGSAVPYRRAA